MRPMGRKLQRWAAWSIALLAADVAALSLEEGPYKLGPELPIGERLPVAGPLYRVYAEHPDRFDFVGNAHQPLTFVAQVSGFCPGNRRAESVTLTVSGVRASTRVGGGRGELFSKRLVVKVPQAAVADFDPVAACNDALRARAAGTTLSRKDWVKSGIALRIPARVPADAVLTCQHPTLPGFFETAEAKFGLWVHCVGHAGGKPAPKEDGDNDKPPLKKAVLQIPPTKPAESWIRGVEWRVDKPEYEGPCPAELVFTGAVHTTRAGFVRYRIRNEQGSAGPERKLYAKGPGAHPLPPLHLQVEVPSSTTRITTGGQQGEAVREGWRRLEITAPANAAAPATAYFRVRCLGEPVRRPPRPAE
ncbi:MAG: hypothetical protein KatS3mg124_1167 [Porticoccaceae bacterium]|nr:MAG: hypothetical protein KatS3mg124_1167 [Porticoccaceae bacterium]